MDWKSYFYGVFSVVVLMLIMISFGAAHLGKASINGNAVNLGSSTSGDNGNIPEKCRVPAGQDVNSWKEHLGHHSETQDCLKYFD